jgi:hypothetical protein
MDSKTDKSFYVPAPGLMFKKATFAVVLKES